MYSRHQILATFPVLQCLMGRAEGQVSPWPHAGPGPPGPPSHLWLLPHPPSRFCLCHQRRDRLLLRPLHLVRLRACEGPVAILPEPESSSPATGLLVSQLDLEAWTGL